MVARETAWSASWPVLCTVYTGTISTGMESETCGGCFIGRDRSGARPLCPDRDRVWTALSVHVMVVVYNLLCSLAYSSKLETLKLPHDADPQ
jgi:hypothetical protein